MADAVASEALGPRPGIAIVSFWQGIVEIVLRVVTAVTAFAALVSTAVELDELAIFPSEGIVNNLNGASRWILAMAVFTITFEIAVIVTRFLNVGLVNSKIKMLLIADISASLFFTVAFICGGVALAKFTNDIADVASTVYFRAAAAATAFSILTMLAMLALAVWMILFLVKGWNKAVAK